MLGAELLFSLSMERSLLFRSRALLSFGRLADATPSVQVELVGRSAGQLLEDWAHKKAVFLESVQKSVEKMARPQR